MTAPSDAPGSPQMDRFLGRAYPRIVRFALVLTAIAGAVSLLLANWRGSLVLIVGAVVGILNLVWLHRGADLMVERMLGAGKSGPSKLRMLLFFPLRYILVIAAVYAILKGYPGVLVSFIVGLGLPVMAMIGESIYEAVVLTKRDRA
jgi:ATP synthase I chain